MINFFGCFANEETTTQRSRDMSRVPEQVNVIVGTRIQLPWLPPSLGKKHTHIKKSAKVSTQEVIIRMSLDLAILRIHRSSLWNPANDKKRPMGGSIFIYKEVGCLDFQSFRMPFLSWHKITAENLNLTINILPMPQCLFCLRKIAPFTNSATNSKQNLLQQFAPESLIVN